MANIGNTVEDIKPLHSFVTSTYLFVDTEHNAFVFCFYHLILRVNYTKARSLQEDYC